MTTIVGKDAPLEQSIAHFQEILKKLKIVVRESNWLNPLNDVYSVHLDIVMSINLFKRKRIFSTSSSGFSLWRAL